MVGRKLMKKALISNGVFSLICGLILNIFSNEIANIFAISNAHYFLIVGIGLIFFSICVVWLAFTEAFHPLLVKFVIVLDVLWVLASIAIIAFNYFAISPTGLVILSIIAVIIAIFAFLQHLGLKKLIEHRSLPEFIQMDDH